MVDGLLEEAYWPLGREALLALVGVCTADNEDGNLTAESGDAKPAHQAEPIPVGGPAEADIRRKAQIEKDQVRLHITDRYQGLRRAGGRRDIIA